MASSTGLRTPDDDVIARLHDAAVVPDVRFDSPAVLAAAQRSLRRRRFRQVAGGVVATGLVALTLAGPLHLSGVGTFAMPGGHQARTVLGLEDPDAPGPAVGLDLSELLGVFVANPPSAEQMDAEAAALEDVVLPVLEELAPTWFENGPCDVLTYPRGAFSVDGTCGGRPGERPFDDTARADLDRILDGVERSGVPTDELSSAEYAPDGTVQSATFLRAGGGIQWNYAYVYSPDGQPPEWQSALGPVTVTRIGDTDWWFERSPND